MGGYWPNSKLGAWYHGLLEKLGQFPRKDFKGRGVLSWTGFQNFQKELLTY